MHYEHKLLAADAVAAFLNQQQISPQDIVSIGPDPAMRCQLLVYVVRETSVRRHDDRAASASVPARVQPIALGPGSDESDAEGARLIALNMMLNGRSDEDIEAQLAEMFPDVTVNVTQLREELDLS